MQEFTQSELEAVILLAAKFQHNPRGFVDTMWAWGKGELEGKSPEEWQYDLLDDIGRASRRMGFNIRKAVKMMQNAQIKTYRDSTAAGHGIGKSALLAWIIIWAMSTFPDTRGYITAGTDTQLKSKTVPEIMKWLRLCLCRIMFDISATKICSADKKHKDSWRIDFIPWSESNPDAFAGLHNEGKRILIIMDEAQQIPQNIYETVTGALTDANTEIYWLMFGNATHANGPFYNTFHGTDRILWNSRHIDSRDVELTNKTEIAQWEASWGEDSDQFRVRVRGLFPQQSAMSLINSKDVYEAQRRPIPDVEEGWVLGVDVGRGGDPSVICPRNGYDARSVPWFESRVKNTMILGEKVVEMAQDLSAVAIFVDMTGVGAGLLDWLVTKAIDRLPMGCVVVGVGFGDPPIEEMRDAADAQDKVDFRFRNSQMYWEVKKWVKLGAIPENPKLETDLTARRYSYWGTKSKIFLEPKESMKKRGLASPDNGDALALTFALPLQLLHLSTDRDEFETFEWGGI